MKDLTQGSITRHLLGMAAFIGFGLVFQTSYFLVDLYFVSQLGKDAVAGVSTAGSLSFVVLALSQIVGVGGLSLISQATGRKEPAEAILVYNQALSLSLAALAGTLVLGYALTGPTMAALAADPVTAGYGRLYLAAFLPSMAFMFPTAAIGSALRATGVVQPTILVQTLSVALNAALAPVLIAGWGTGLPLGVAGAGLASSVASGLGLVLLLAVFPRVQAYLRTSPAQLRPRWAIWRRIIAIGLPSAAEFLLMFLILAIIYWATRRFGATAQAGFGIGMRVMQSIFLPAMAIAFAAAPVAGQNFGAGRTDRVRATFVHAALGGSLVMVTLTLLCQWRPAVLVGPFTSDPAVAAVAVEYLGIQSWNFVATGLTFACSAMFQALGNTKPSLLSSGSRLVSFALPVIWLAQRPETVLADFWHLSVASVTLQAAISLILLRVEFARKLGPTGRSELVTAGS